MILLKEEQLDMLGQKQIVSFSGPYHFLSNFHLGESTIRENFRLEDGTLDVCELTGNSVEHVYQACKCKHAKDIDYILNASTPGQAKKRGNLKSLEMCPDWEKEKIDIMARLIHDKFVYNLELRNKLIVTGNFELIEGNTWKDRFWGMVRDKDGIFVGENHLGRILMNDRTFWISREKILVDAGLG